MPFDNEKIRVLTPSQFYLIKGHLHNGNKALCGGTQSLKNIPDILLERSTQRLLAQGVQKARTSQGVLAANVGHPLFVRYIQSIVRNKQPVPWFGYEGIALEFVQSWNLKKIAVQLIVALLVFFCAGLITGFTTGSVDRGFLVGGLGIALSQLLVAVLVFAIPPPIQ